MTPIFAQLVNTSIRFLHCRLEKAADEPSLMYSAHTGASCSDRGPSLTPPRAPTNYIFLRKQLCMGQKTAQRNDALDLVTHWWIKCSVNCHSLPNIWFVLLTENKNKFILLSLILVWPLPVLPPHATLIPNIRSVKPLPVILLIQVTRLHPLW